MTKNKKITLWSIIILVILAIVALVLYKSCQGTETSEQSDTTEVKVEKPKIIKSITETTYYADSKYKKKDKQISMTKEFDKEGKLVKVFGEYGYEINFKDGKITSAKFDKKNKMKVKGNTVSYSFSDEAWSFGQFTYNENGDITKEQSGSEGVSTTITSTFDKNGLRQTSKVVDDDMGEVRKETVKYQYDKNDSTWTLCKYRQYGNYYVIERTIQYW